MVPKIHAKGTSFVDAARYVLHDKGADTDERVQWAKTYNIGTNNPEAAARVMAYTAMDAPRLKKQAGIPNTGRKSKQHVFHATLSWHADESGELTDDHQYSAAKWFLDKLGAGDRQAIIVAHNDGPHPHVHILVNRISHKDGRMLSSSLEKIKASQWAEKYERDRGKIYCDQRVINNAARKRGDFVRGQKDEPRHFVELRAEAGNDNQLRKKAEQSISHAKNIYAQIKEHERQGLSKKDALTHQLQRRLHNLREELPSEITKAKQRIQKRFADEWSNDYYAAQAELAKFTIQERGFIGKVKNALSAVDFAGLMGEDYGHPNLGRIGKLGQAFKALGDAGVRLQLLKKQQTLRQLDIRRRQNTSQAIEISKARELHTSKKKQIIKDYRQQRDQTYGHHATVKQALSEKLKVAHRHRRQAWLRYQTEKGQRAEKPVSPNASSSPQNTKPNAFVTKRDKANSGESGGQQTKASDLVPKQGSDDAASKIDSYKAIADELIAKEEARKKARDDDGRDDEMGR